MRTPTWLASLGLAAALSGSSTGATAQHLPGHAIDQKELCLSCHDLEADLGAPIPHAPVEAGECSACHNPHVARFASLLRDRPGPLCARCHDDVGDLEERASVHAPVAEGRCADCHKAHGSQHAGLLVSGAESLCLTCHEQIAGWQERQVRHAPFAAGQCATCHDPHASEAAGLLAKDGAALCRDCHALDASLRRHHGGQPVEKAACHQCHEPHASARSGLLRESVHAPFESGDCTTCHPGPGAADPFATVKPLDVLCGDCHEQAVTASREASFPHVSAGGGGCATCHNPHTGDGSGLLVREPQALCTSCHDPGGARSGESGRHLTHSGFACTTCHDPHGSERPLLFADDEVELCGSCHSHEHNVRHPLGDETRDSRTGARMTCRSCHGIHRSDGEMYLYEEDQRMLCIGCHKDLKGR